MNRTERKLKRERLLAFVGGLSNPSKMPTLSYSTPAYLCPLGSLLAEREGSTCSDCYALKGRYIMPNVMAAMERRAAAVRLALSDSKERWKWVDAMAWLMHDRLHRTEIALARNGKPGADDGRCFRWHDSGDVWSVEHLNMLNDVALACPSIRFWLPSREAGMVAKWHTTYLGGFAPNLNVRLSVPMVDEAPAGLLLTLAAEHANVSTSGVHTFGTTYLPPFEMARCVAPLTNGECRDCRACWVPEIKHISYRKH